MLRIQILLLNCLVLFHFSAKLGKPRMPKGHQVSHQKTKIPNKAKVPKRNLAAKYYGIQPPSWPDS